MSTEFLNEVNWPAIGQGNPSELSKALHKWCGNISKFVLSLHERVQSLENKETSNVEAIKQLKIDLEAAKNSTKSTSISSDWVQVVTAGRSSKKPADQNAVANATISEFKEREKRKKNVIVYGVPESTKEVLTDTSTEDEEKVKQIFEAINKSDVKPVYTRRLRSRDSNKPGPLIIELSDASLRNSVLLAAKSLRNKQEFSKFISVLI